MELKRIGLDTSKHVFTLHGIDAGDRAVLRRNLSRGQVEGFFRKLPATEVALEACGASHHWGRVLTALGHRVKLLPPQYVKPYVKRGKNDAADAAAICEAAGRPGMRTVPVKSAEQQAALLVLRVRDQLVKQRTQQVNALRGHAAEFGLVVPKGIERVVTLRALIAAAPGLPALAREMLGFAAETLDVLDQRIDAAEARLAALHKESAMSRQLTTMPGVGPVVAISFALSVDPAQFESGRHFAAWMGLTPKDHSSGGKQRLGGISRAGNERLRQLLVLGATAVIQHARPGKSSAWLLGLLARKPRKLAAVALANKMARAIWAMMTREEEWRAPVVAAA